MTGNEGHDAPATALVLAASRKGGSDPVAKLQDKSHKCLVEVDGVAMIERVVQALLDSRRFSRILISIENEQILQTLPSTRRWLEEGVIHYLASAENLADSVLYLDQDGDLPLVVTTADSAMHTAQLIQDFMAAFAQSHADVAVAVTPESTVIEEYPDANLGFFRFRDGGYSFCNIYGIRSRKGLEAARVFRSGGQFRKRPWRILKEFGVLPLILYKYRLASLNGILQRLGRKLDLTIEPITLPYAFAPIDVDNPRTFALSEETLKRRRLKSHSEAP